MIIKQDVNGNVLEIQCDICKARFDVKEEMDEFICFDYVMGEGAQYPDKQIQADICQDCFIEAFPTLFEDEEAEPEMPITFSNEGY